MAGAKPFFKAQRNHSAAARNRPTNPSVTILTAKSALSPSSDSWSLSIVWAWTLHAHPVTARARRVVMHSLLSAATMADFGLALPYFLEIVELKNTNVVYGPR